MKYHCITSVERKIIFVFYKAFKGTVVNTTFHPANEGSFEITFTFPLNLYN